MNEVVIHNGTGEVIKTLSFDFYVEKIHGGKYLGVAGGEFVLFYDWQGEESKGKIDVELKDVYWSGEDKVIIASEKSVYVLKEKGEEEFELSFDCEEQLYHG